MNTAVGTTKVFNIFSNILFVNMLTAYLKVKYTRNGIRVVA